MWVVSLALYLDEQGVVPVALLACFFHELGHLITLYALGGRLSYLRLGWAGAEMAVVGQLGYGGEVMLALSGPLANFILAVATAYRGSFPLFCGLNLALALVNLVPVGGLDGGRILHGIWGGLWGEDRAQRIQDGINLAIGFLLLAGGIAIWVLGGSVTLLLFAIWVLWSVKIQKNSKKTLAKK